jgi:hypothetical protein
MKIELLKPSLETLNRYVEALERGWSPDNVRGFAAAEEQLRKIEHDAAAFVDGLDDPNAVGDPIVLPDGRPWRGCRVSYAGYGMAILRARLAFGGNRERQLCLPTC